MRKSVLSIIIIQLFGGKREKCRPLKNYSNYVEPLLPGRELCCCGVETPCPKRRRIIISTILLFYFLLLLLLLYSSSTENKCSFCAFTIINNGNNKPARHVPPKEAFTTSALFLVGRSSVVSFTRWVRNPLPSRPSPGGSFGASRPFDTSPFFEWSVSLQTMVGSSQGLLIHQQRLKRKDHHPL